MANPELGSKRQCQNCGAKFFDLNRQPIICPKCATVFQPPVLTRSPPRAAARKEDDEADAPVIETVSLEDAEAEESKAAAPVGDDIEVEEDEVAADETFLEEEEEEADDVADLIDGDIETDEES